MSENDADLKKIKELIKIMRDHDLVEVELRHDDDKILLKRAQPQAPSSGTITAIPFVTGGANMIPGPSVAHKSPAEAGANAQQEEALEEIKSPMVGTFYEAPSPDSEPYVEIGSHVDSNTVVCIIEAMKVMNEIKAEANGTVVALLANNGQAVEFGQPLFKIRPD